MSKPKRRPFVLDEFVGCDNKGRWFVTASVEETKPGIWETILCEGWLPGMQEGWEILKVERVDNRPLYTVRDDTGKVKHRCMRRRAPDPPGPSGWCTSPPLKGTGYCIRHQYGEQPLGMRRRATMWYPGEDGGTLPGYYVAGYIPCNTTSSPGGDTYFIFFRHKDGTEGVRSACLRHKISFDDGRAGAQCPSCLNPAGHRTGRDTGPCAAHAGRSTGNSPMAMINYLDPKYSSLLRVASDVDPAVAKLRNRMDILRYSWFLFLSAISRRDEMLKSREKLARERMGNLTPEEEIREQVDRSLGINDIMGLAGLIITGTKLQSKDQQETFKTTGKIWAQQTYALQLGLLLVEIADREGAAVRRRVSRNLEHEMDLRGLLGGNQRLRWSGDDGEEEVMPDGDEPEPGQETMELALTEEEITELAEMRPRNRYERDLLNAMSDRQKVVAYKLTTMQLGRKMFSLYPLIAVLDEMKNEEERMDAPVSVKKAILGAIQQAQSAQQELDNSLGIVLSRHEQAKITDRIVDAVAATVEKEAEIDPSVAARLMFGVDGDPNYRGWNERQAEINLPKDGHQAVGDYSVEIVRKYGRSRQADAVGDSARPGY